MKSLRKRKQIMRMFSNACYVMEKYEVPLETRHNMFVDCRREADKSHQVIEGENNKQLKDHEKIVATNIKIRANRQLLAQEIFIAKVVKENPKWFEEVNLNSIFLVIKPKK